MQPRSKTFSLQALAGGSGYLSAWEAVLDRKKKARAVLSETGEVLRTFSEIQEESIAWMTRFHEERLSPGEVVGIQIGNVPEWAAMILACFRSHLIPLPIGGHMGEREREAVLRTLSVSVLVEKKGNRFCLTRREGVLPPSWRGCECPPAFLKLTSGTTSTPRGVRFQQDQLLEDGLQIVETMGLTEGDLNYGVIPISHSYGFSNLLTPLLCSGIPMVISEDRMPRAILKGLAQSNATVFPGMPIFFDKFCGLEGVPPLPSLRLCISAGAPLSPELATRFFAQFGVPIQNFYGSSETGGISFVPRDCWNRGDGYVGRAMSRVKLTPLEEGAFSIESRAVGDGYWPLEEFAGDGRFIPGDRVRISEEGVFIEGRLSDFINIAGRKLNPAEVEAVLSKCPGVRGVSVFGVQSPLRNEEAVACVAGEVNEVEVLRFARERLSPWQVPKGVWVVSEIPVNERGKINRRDLAKQYETMRG